MDIATVIGTVVCTRKEEKLRGYKLLLVSAADNPKTDPNPVVAVDTVGAGIGERVMVVRGSSARAVANLETTPVDAAVVGIIDDIECDGKVIYRKGAAPDGTAS